MAGRRAREAWESSTPHVATTRPPPGCARPGPPAMAAAVPAADERHGGAARAVVVELVDLERRHDPPAPGLLDQVPRRDGRGVAGVEEPVEDEHHGELGHACELGYVVDDVDQPVGIGHGSLSG